MIPKIIHYFWFGKNPLPIEVKQCIESWKKFCPDYEIQRWGESNFDVTQNQYCREAYEAKKWAFVSDYARLKVLYDHGGIYMDTDVEVVKELDGLLEYDAFSGFESTHYISTGTMGAVQGNGWIRDLLKEYDTRHFLLKNGDYDLTTNVIRITALTKRLYGIRLDGSFQIFGDHMALFPFDYLCAKSYETGKILQSDQTLTIHHFAGSWLSDEEQAYLRKLKQWQKHHEKIYALRMGRAFFKVAAAYRCGGLQMVMSKIRRST